MQRRAGEPELRDLLGGRERELLEIGLSPADVPLTASPGSSARNKNTARVVLKLKPACATEDYRWLDPIAVDHPLDHIDRQTGQQRNRGDCVLELPHLRKGGDPRLAQPTRLTVNQAPWMALA